MTVDVELLPLPVGYSADEWGGRDTGPCLYLDEQMQHYARANVLHHAANLQREVDALRKALRELVEYVRETTHHNAPAAAAARAVLSDQKALNDMAERIASDRVAAKPADDWYEDTGPVVWWSFPVEEPAWIGTPLDDDWPGYHTHWTPHPAAPAPPRPQTED